MANPILFKSSLILGIIHLIAIFITNKKKYEYKNIEHHRQLLIYNVLGGIFTSILNHSTTSTLSKWLDRSMMVIGIYNDIYLIKFITNPTDVYSNLKYLSPSLSLSMSQCELNMNMNMNQLFIYYFLSLSILSFLFSKIISKKNNEFGFDPFLLQMSFHITSHILLTTTHIIMFIYI
jgi:hypothetical protein